MVGAVEFAGMARSPKARSSEESFWERNERIRVEELRADAKRPPGELLDRGVALSRFACELRAAAANSKRR